VKYSTDNGLSGGIGFFSPERGWACDSVTNFEVVLANGAVINANTTSHNDLFAALKGGQNNLGVVTRFDLKTLSQGLLWGGAIFYSNSVDEELLDTFTAFKDPDRFDPYAMITFGFTYDAVKRAFGTHSVPYYSHPEGVENSTLGSFAKIQPQIYSSIRIASPGSFAGEKLTPDIKSY
jgi:FAD/FMN-containing dehydrogenase